MEATNKKIKAHTTRRFYYDNVKELKEHLYAYILSYNFQINLRAIGRKPSFEAIREYYQKMPDIFVINPDHLSVGLNS